MGGLLTGKNVVITGAAAGIGRSVAQVLAEEGANLAILDLNEEALNTACKELAGTGVKVLSYVCDLSKVEGHEALIEKIENELGPIDVLVNNAGVSLAMHVLEMTVDKWDFVQGINLRGTFFMTQPVFRRMMERKKGRIINMASISGDRPADKSDVSYCTSKAGIIMMTKVFAKAAKDTEITVNSVSPGIIDTELTRKLGNVVTSDKVPMGRMGQKDEVAKAVLFLASDLSSYVSGQNIRVNGGQFML